MHFACSDVVAVATAAQSFLQGQPADWRRSGFEHISTRGSGTYSVTFGRPVPA
jgi:hypothetical protein